MKTILVDAINTFVILDKGIFHEMYQMLEKFPNRKIILTGADDIQIKKFGLNKMPYQVFTLKHNPEKTNPNYYRKMLDHFNLTIKDVIYFEHHIDAVKSAESIGIKTFHYNKDKKDLTVLKAFIDQNI
ncbi:hypothetical protein [Marinifilum sp. D737]|uniref:hypothetical protein n=1 Tax=Marinifilum sp. D737 TaxID=2969628 RepID=UPI0022725896|nr:hypothetical protein [Marinifilum sp. D737]MCY1634879.1 hypothetical protein [Marinifilum sp. D737]